MITYLQRQFGGFLGAGDTVDENQYGLTDRVWNLLDVYPSTIMRLQPGKFSTTLARLDAALSATHAVELPSGYSALSRLSFTLRTDQAVRISVVSPDHPDSTSLVYVPAGEFGFYSVVESITSIKIVNVSASDARIEYVCFEYPDLEDDSTWLDGIQTLGVSTT